ncbi:uncharacterized protein H6S33_000096 [Morchella sextelata]|uniref:uncharacterized protein n=1 Tax=Morchella sextelata TaxID=1174677 RepID=UPI001D041848|nr:uncharacterized protein H6S33_000096 [Morchella sextelata]KAH0614460.1 hypothetical protein H6S33_000096 [Morchella sextelata]
MSNLEVLSIAELEAAAMEKMDKMTREYYNSGSDREITLRDNLAAFDRYRLRPRVLKDVSRIDTSTQLWGKKISFPLCIAPAAMAKLAHPSGEVGISRAAANAGVAVGLSSFSTSSMEDVVAQGAGAVDYAIQLYVFQNRKTSEALVRRAERAGFKAVFLTVDTPYLGRRINEVRNRFKLPPHLQLLNFENPGDVAVYSETETKAHDGDKGKPPAAGAGVDSIVPQGNVTDASLNWETDIQWLRSITKLEIWVKGILTAEDTLLAVQHGVDGIIISNHGGRQLDGVTSTLDALPECVAAAAGRIPVHIDGGIRRGTDIFKALALGADCCWIGRIPLWGLAYDGQAGVELALKLLYEEFRLCMGLAGCKSVKEISRDHLIRVKTDGTLARL